MTYCVYKHTSPSNKVYIGITGRDPKMRWANGKAYAHNKHFILAINKYGWNSFKHEILYDGMTKEQAEETEILLIAKYKSNDRRYGYNISKGGEVVRQGIRHTDETKRKISQSITGRKKSKEFCQKQSKRLKGITPRWCLPYCHSADAERKRWETVKANPEYQQRVDRFASNRRRPVAMIDENGQIINTFSSVKEAEDKTSIDYTSISKTCSNKRKSAGGFRWVYL